MNEEDLELLRHAQTTGGNQPAPAGHDESDDEDANAHVEIPLLADIHRLFRPPGGCIPVPTGRYASAPDVAGASWSSLSPPSPPPSSGGASSSSASPRATEVSKADFSWQSALAVEDKRPTVQGLVLAEARHAVGTAAVQDRDARTPPEKLVGRTVLIQVRLACG